MLCLLFFLGGGGIKSHLHPPFCQSCLGKLRLGTPLNPPTAHPPALELMQAAMGWALPSPPTAAVPGTHPAFSLPER